ncbi:MULTISPECIES: DUF885 domain-containing protein [Methylomonas]|uniref:DUF885 domain-containing protein n=2 Tax=Methylomonas TaxID=416 RepID=A0A140E768_9GAMM|nr:MULTISPECIES: DUF885 domain-containing protein [Methylomonas]AMK79242.1 hypothetical protein JT25_022610 [Methylomonas denitrificans]OAH98129.1 hypothetical protein A1342_00205 [Methylomonas methanica]TCV86239.1 uncharacterized protein DUF885 [Methylomonas methanica]
MLCTTDFQGSRAIVSILILLLCFGQALAATQAPPSWDAFVGEFIEQYFQLHPSFAANAGRHEFDGKLPDWSAEGLARQSQWLVSQRELANRYRDTAIKEAERFEQNHLQAVIDEELFWLQSAKSPAKNPLFYSQALDPNFYLTRPYAPLEQRLRAFVNYAANIPKAAAQIRANLKPPLPRSYIDVGKTIFTGLATFYETDAKATFAAVDNPQLQQQFNTVVPAAAKAMRELADWLEQQRGSANDDFALGASRFRAMLKASEGVVVPLETLEKMGRADLERNLAALTQECKQYAPDASVPECVAKVEGQKPADGAVAEAGRQLVQLKAFLTEKNLLSIPGREEAAVAETPPFKRWNSAYIDIPGPFEHALPSIYYVAPPDPAWSAAEQAAYVPSKANLLFISAHEVWPGHFLQHLHADRAASKLGQLFSSYAFSEGWAHYAEELMWEAGLNAGDAQTHIGQLLNALLRNVRFLSALGLHTQGMTVETSEKMFREQAFRDQGTAKQQAARGTFDPGYLNYTLGKLMIRKLRGDWSASRGGRAAWKSFHDSFLSYGAPPIPLIRQAMLGDDRGSDL